MNGIKYSLLILTFMSFLFLGCSGNENSKDTKSNKPSAKEYWTCTMHPQVRMDGPGACPICGMDLIKKTEEVKEPTTGNESDMDNMVALTGKKQVLANVSTVKVLREKLNKEISVYSYLDFAEQSRKVVSARFSGRIERLYVDRTGQYIKKGEPLFEIYSPDLVQAQNDFLIALTGMQQIDNSSLVTAAKNKLALLGMTTAQIKEIEETRKIKNILPYYSPVSGTVIEKKVQEGVYVNEGSSIFEIAELSTLWNISEINEKDLGSIRIGATVKLNLKAFPQEEFTGKVTFIYPVVNSKTRTIKIRSEVANKGGKLKPQMYGETVFSTSSGEGLLVPAEALIFSGKRTVVWVKASDGMFEARDVKTGSKYGKKYHVLEGLEENEEVAASGGFLIDSESQLKSGMPSGHQHGETSTPKKEGVVDKSTKKSEEHKNH